MNRYQLQEEIGDGSFGRVIKAQNKDTGEIVAIKHIKKQFKVSRKVFNCVNDGLYFTNLSSSIFNSITSANNRIGTAV